MILRRAVLAGLAWLLRAAVGLRLSELLRGLRLTWLLPERGLLQFARLLSESERWLLRLPRLLTVLESLLRLTRLLSELWRLLRLSVRILSRLSVLALLLGTAVRLRLSKLLPELRCLLRLVRLLSELRRLSIRLLLPRLSAPLHRLLRGAVRLLLRLRLLGVGIRRGLTVLRRLLLWLSVLLLSLLRSAELRLGSVPRLRAVRLLTLLLPRLSAELSRLCVLLRSAIGLARRLGLGAGLMRGRALAVLAGRDGPLGGRRLPLGARGFGARRGALPAVLLRRNGPLGGLGLRNRSGGLRVRLGGIGFGGGVGHGSARYPTYPGLVTPARDLSPDRGGSLPHRSPGPDHDGGRDFVAPCLRLLVP